jgi:uncharacterized membrane protein YgdD (TMEM256/DUF423 family)
MSPKHWIFCGALMAALAVAAGAFGAHGLKGKLTTEQLVTFETAARYQMYHALGMVLVGIGTRVQRRKGWQIAGWAFLLGTLAFSGGLYAWLFTQQKWLMMVVPMGGATFIVGWVALAVCALWEPSEAA